LAFAPVHTAQDQLAKANADLQEGIAGIETVKSTASEEIGRAHV